MFACFLWINLFLAQVENALRRELRTGIKEKYKVVNQEGLREAWDNVQSKVRLQLLSCEKQKFATMHQSDLMSAGIW